MLIKTILICLHYSLHFGQLRARLSPQFSNPTTENSVVNIFVDLSKVRQSAPELVLLTNLLNDHTRPKRVFKMSNLALDYVKHYRNCNFKSYTDPKMTSRFNQETASFIMPAIPKWVNGYNLYQVQSSLSYCGEDPNFMFLVDTEATAKLPISLNSYPLLKWTTKLFVLNPIQLEMYVLCYSCAVYPLRQIETNPRNLLAQQWKMYNQNLNGMQCPVQCRSGSPQKEILAAVSTYQVDHSPGQQCAFS